MMGLVVMAVVGLALLAHSSPRPLIARSLWLVCQVWSWEKGDWKTVMCIERPRVRGAREPAILPTATEMAWPTATPTIWEPWSTATRTATEEPYPVEETGTPGPYP